MEVSFGAMVAEALGTLLAIFWIFLWLRYRKKYEKMIAGIQEEQYDASEFFFIGFGFLELIHFSTKTDHARKKIKEIGEIRGRKYAEFYYFVMVAAMATYLLSIFPIALLLGAMTGEMLLAGLGVILGVLLVWYLNKSNQDKIKARREALLRDMPGVLSKLTLLINSGMTMHEAWKKVAEKGEGIFYKEMQKSVIQMEYGMSEWEAYEEFSKRCGVKEIKRFISTIRQNLDKGNAELTRFLRDMNDEMWEEKKATALQKGQVAANKLLVPTMLIFIGILLMIMGPMVTML